MNEELLPESIVNEGGEMRIRWPDGLLRRFSNAFLRAHCECAQCKSLRGGHGNEQDPVPADLRVTEIHPVGTYAVQLVFSDGHRRGIFPWAYLRGLYESEAASPTSRQ
jgi:DUF971 family protein